MPVSVVTLTIALCTIDKGALHLLLCDHHTAWADSLMPVLSDTCHWLPYVIAGVLLLWRWRTGLFTTVCLLLSTAFTQTFKHIVQAPRPLTWFAENMPEVTLPLTPGVNMHYFLSFPSGHATTFFCLYCTLSVLVTHNLPRDKKLLGIILQAVFFALAAVSSYTRIYLSQHFSLDVLGGMIIGVLSVLLTCYIYSLPKLAKIAI